MAKIFLESNDTFTQSSTNTGDTIFGGTGSETVILQGNPDGTLLDGNVEEVQVAGNAADTTLQVNAQGQLELSSGGTVYATFTAGLNAAVDLQFEDGNVTLKNTAGGVFTVEDPADDTDSATIDANTAQTGDAVTLGSDDSTAGDGSGGGGTGDGETFVLTAGANDGTSGDDTFIGARGSIEGAIINAGAGTDTLNATLDNANDNGAALNAQSLEIVNLRAIDALSIDLADSGVPDQVWSNRTTANELLTLENADAATIYGIHDNSGDLLVEILDVEDTDTVQLYLDEAEGGQFAAGTAETLAITGVNNESTLDLDTDDATNAFTTITVAGDQDIDLGTLNAEVESLTVTGSGGVTAVFDGAVDKTVNGNAGADSVTLTGAGDDTVSLAAGNDTLTVAQGALDADDDLDGGDGDDTLATTGQNGADVFGVDVSGVVTGFETLQVTTDNADTLDMDNITTVSNVTVINGDDDDTMDITNLTQAQATAGVRFETGDAATDNQMGDRTVALDDATGDSDSINITVVNNFDGTTGDTDLIRVDDIEAVNIEATFDSDITTEANQVFEIDSLEADAAETITFTGDAGLTVALTDGVTDQVVNAAGMTGFIDLTAEQTVDYSITGSAGDDTFTMTDAMNGDDTVDGGDGDDTVEAAVDSTDGDVTLTLANISNVETIAVAVTQDAAENGGETATIDMQNVTGRTVSITGNLTAAANTDTTAVTNLAAGTSLEINGDYTNGGAGDYIISAALENASGSSDSLTVSLTQGDNNDQTLDSVNIEDVESLTLSVTPDDNNANVDEVTVSNLDIDGVETLTVTSEEDLVFTLIDEADELETIDFTGASEDITVSLDGADDTGVNILLGNPNDAANDIAITLDSDGGASDKIVFGDSEVGDVAIGEFTEGDGILADVLDFSALGITALSDLTITQTGGGDTLINADEFDGEIQLTGVANADLNAANFDFA